VTNRRGGLHGGGPGGPSVVLGLAGNRGPTLNDVVGGPIMERCLRQPTATFHKETAYELRHRQCGVRMWPLISWVAREPDGVADRQGRLFHKHE